MDWFWNLFDAIIQNHIWNVLFGHFRLVDWVTSIFAIIGLVYGLKQGFFRCLAVILETIPLLWFVMAFYKKIGSIVLQNLPFVGETRARPVAYIVLLLLGGILTILIDGRLKTIFHTKLAGPVRAAGGAVCGVFFLLLVWSLIAHIFVIWPSGKMHAPFTDGGSITGGHVARLAPSIYNRFAHSDEIMKKSKA